MTYLARRITSELIPTFGNQFIMENIFKRFQLVGRMIIKKLDPKSLTRSIEASREISKFLDNEKFFFITIIKNYKSNFKGFEHSWNEVIHKTPVKIIKQLAIAVQIRPFTLFT